MLQDVSIYFIALLKIYCVHELRKKTLGSCAVKKQISLCLTQLVTESNWLCIL